jgi:hypothetical protein
VLTSKAVVFIRPRSEAVTMPRVASTRRICRDTTSHCSNNASLDSAASQRRVGTALASRVLRAAEKRGYDRFVVHVLWHNVPVLKILRRVGEVMATTMRGGVLEIVFVRQRPPLVGAESMLPGSCASP